ncbi:MAG: hypothetical protein N2043_13165 [Ignavibacterium sp.]|nr:hypothetical protein [Ignavibacterium sp.]
MGLEFNDILFILLIILLTFNVIVILLIIYSKKSLDQIFEFLVKNVKSNSNNEMQQLVNRLNQINQNIQSNIEKNEQLKRILIEFEQKIFQLLKNDEVSTSTLVSDNKNQQDQIETINVIYDKQRLQKVNIEKYYKLEKRNGKYYLLISDNILNLNPTPEFDSKIELFYELIRKQNPRRYKLLQPTELSFYDENSGEFEIKVKGKVSYE